MRIWRFQPRPQPQGQGSSSNDTSSGSGSSSDQSGGAGLLPATPGSIDAIRQVGVFRIYREALTGPVAPQGQESQLNQFLQQLSQQLSSGSSGQQQSSGQQ
eukprot:TRINITY_DN9781_c0_g1_i1.p2 TRINITY_DN9781_c0_g1~~TRINITY_DN9781_c0_g1_i1.p2  ORF type:complete len:101 (+),score=29.19 TRINITY_DN9781_c0_g1_i1:361-663(+)